MPGHSDFDQNEEVVVVNKKAKYLGIPDDYAAAPPVGGHLGLQPGAPTTPKPYTEADALSLIMGQAPGWVASFQRAMVEMGQPFGFGKSTKFVPGRQDKNTLSAWERVLGFANQRGLTWQQALQELRSTGGGAGFSVGGGGGGGGSAGPPPLVIKLSSPDDIRFIAEDVGRNVLGRKPNKIETDLITQAVHRSEREAQKRSRELALGSGGEVVQPPNPQVIAEQELRGVAETEAGAHDIAGQFQNFLKIVGG